MKKENGGPVCRGSVDGWGVSTEEGCFGERTKKNRLREEKETKWKSTNAHRLF